MFRMVKNFKIAKRSCSLNRYYRVITQLDIFQYFQCEYPEKCRSFAGCAAQKRSNHGITCTQIDGSLGVCCQDITNNPCKFFQTQNCVVILFKNASKVKISCDLYLDILMKIVLIHWWVKIPTFAFMYSHGQ